MSRKKLIAIIVLLAVVIGFFLVRGNSFSIAIAASGYRTDNVKTLHSGVDANGNEFCMIKVGAIDEEGFAILHMVKGFMGFWSCLSKYTSVEGMASGGFADFNEEEWQDGIGLKMYFHVLYYGTTAIGKVEIYPEQIPDYTTVTIQQDGSEFYVHVITNAELEPEDTLNVPLVLYENGCIESNIWTSSEKLNSP